MFRFQNDEMTAKLLVFIRHFQITPSPTTFVKEVFGLDAWFRKCLLCEKKTP